MTTSGGGPDADRLIEQLRARAADPDGRTERRPSIFEAAIGTMSLGSMLSVGRSIADSLRRVVESNEAGRMPEADVLATAERVQREMTTPAPAGSLGLATLDAVAAAERALGITFPPFLTRLYAEVADGGFGPGTGLLPLDRLVRETQELRRGDVLPRNRTWPAGLLPFVDRDPGWLCVDVERGTIIEWDPEDLEERTGEERFRRSFTEISPSLEAWLEQWLRRMAALERKPSQEERWARMAERARSPVGQARQEARTRAYLAQMSPEDRKRWGLDELYPDIDTDSDSSDGRGGQ